MNQLNLYTAFFLFVFSVAFAGVLGAVELDRKRSSTVRCEQTSPEVAAIAGRVLDDPRSTSDMRKLAASALAQTRNRR